MRFDTEPVPIAIYRTDLKRLIAVVSSGVKANRLIFGRYSKGLHSYVQRSSKAHPKTTGLDYTVAFRRATTEQIKLLNGEDCILFDSSLHHRLIDIRPCMVPSNEPQSASLIACGTDSSRTGLS